MAPGLRVDEVDNADDVVCERDEEANDDAIVEGGFGVRREPRLMARSAWV